MKPNKKISKLTDHLGYWLRMISNNVSYSFANKLNATGVTVAEWVVLREMYDSDDTISPSQVAELTGLTRGAISKLVTRLLEKNLVTRKEANTDRRYQDIQLTPNAVSLVPKLAAIADENDEFYFSVLTRAERKQLVLLLGKIAYKHKISTTPIE